MRIFVALLVVLAILAFWDTEYNHRTLTNGLIGMERSIVHNIAP